MSCLSCYVLHLTLDEIPSGLQWVAVCCSGLGSVQSARYSRMNVMCLVLRLSCARLHTQWVAVCCRVLQCVAVCVAVCDVSHVKLD